MFGTPRAAFVALFCVLGLAACVDGERVASVTTDGGAGARMAEVARVCAPVGSWVDPRAGTVMSASDAAARMASASALLLGETHTRADHHIWQAQAASMVLARRERVALGFEMFPASADPALARWSAGETDLETFLDEARWETSWGFGEDIYRPLFELGRLNGLPMHGLNLPRALVSRAGREGWAAIADSEGVPSRPRAPVEAYRRDLAAVYVQHVARRTAGSDDEGEAVPSAESVLDDPGFQRFVLAQQLWDRSMAERMAGALADGDIDLIVGFAGSGHLRRGHGIPWQLADLGVSDVVYAVPVDRDEACAGIPEDLADLIFVTAPEPARAAPVATAAPPPRLGVIITAGDAGVQVESVVPGSVADRARLRGGDVIVEAAGEAVRRPAELREIIGRQAPGTWLPLRVQRAGARFERIAVFPPRAMR